MHPGKKAGTVNQFRPLFAAGLKRIPARGRHAAAVSKLREKGYEIKAVNPLGFDIKFGNKWYSYFWEKK